MEYQTITKDFMMAELGATYKSNYKSCDRIKISRSTDSVAYLRSIWDDNKIEYIEEFVIILLNTANETLGWVKISSGGTNMVVVDPKVVFQLALIHNAKAIILSHNHPSGNTTPSDADKTLTKKLVDCGKLLDIDVLDHVILSDKYYFSFADSYLI